jgi:hypothetical protein
MAPAKFQPNAPASEEALAALRMALQRALPPAILEFRERANGGEGFIRGRYAFCHLAMNLRGLLDA